MRAARHEPFDALTALSMPKGSPSVEGRGDFEKNVMTIMRPLIKEAKRVSYGKYLTVLTTPESFRIAEV